MAYATERENGCRREQCANRRRGHGACSGEFRTFFALWPTSWVRERLAEIAATALAGQRGRVAPAENLHLTLAFLGELDAGARACVESHVTADRTAGFSVVFDRLGHWPRSQIVWSAPTAETPALAALVGALWRDVTDCALLADPRPYRPI